MIKKKLAAHICAIWRKDEFSYHRKLTGKNANSRTHAFWQKLGNSYIQNPIYIITNISI